MKNQINFIVLVLFVFLFSSCKEAHPKVVQISQKRIVSSKKQSETVKIDSSYQRSHLLTDCKNKLSFYEVLNNECRVSKRKKWKFAKIDIKSFMDVTDTRLLNADFGAWYLDKDKHGELPSALNIKVGDFFIAKSTTRVNNYYVVKFVGHIGKKVKIEHKIYKIGSIPFFKLDEKDKIAYCLRNNDKITFQDLIDKNEVDINLCTKYQRMKTTALIMSIRKNNVEMFDFLIQNGADIDLGCRGNRTALMSAANQGNQYFFIELMRLGADTKIVDERGNTIKEYIKNYDKYELLEYIKN